MRAVALGTPGLVRTKLNQLVLSGAETATTGLLSEYERECEELEHVEERLAVVGDSDRYVATVEITALEVCRRQRRHPFVCLAFQLVRTRKAPPSPGDPM